MGCSALSLPPADETPATLLPGQWALGRYQVLALVGEGAMSEVYEAIDTSGRSVAVKVLRPEWQNVRDVRTRFQREAEAVQRIDHRHVVRVLDTGELEDGTSVQVLEFFDGVTLETYLDHGSMRIHEVLTLGAQLGRGLEAAHAAGVVHRDLKPENVMLQTEGDELLAKILDFGIARTDAGPNLTLPGSVLGTPCYMAPEQAVPGRSVDARADIYALGCMLYELVTDEVPFACVDPMQTVLAHVGKAPPDPRALRPDCPSSLAQIIARCLEKDPARRYDDAALLVAALEAVARGEELVRGAPLSERTSAPQLEVTEVEEPVGDMSRVVVFDPASMPIDIADVAAMRARERDGEPVAEDRPTPPPPQPWVAGPRRWWWSLAMLLPAALGAACCAL